MNAPIPQLTHLESAGLIAVEPADRELEYRFRHALLQETVYGSLTRKERKLLHHIVGSTLEQLYPERIDELAPLLADHFLVAGDQAQALKYALHAGKTAQSSYANIEAAMYYRKALGIARDQSAPCEARDELLEDLCLRLGRVLELAGKFEEAATHYEEMEQLAIQCGHPHLELVTLLAHATILSTPTVISNLQSGRRLVERAIQLARQLTDPALEAKAYWVLMLVEMFANNLEESERAGEKSLTLARALTLREQIGYTLNDLANYVYVMTSGLEKAYSALEEAKQIWEELNNLPMLTDVLTNLGMIDMMAGNLARGEEETNRAYQISESTANVWGKSYSLGVAGHIYALQGKIEKALKTLQESILLGEQVGFTAVRIICRSILAVIYLHLGAYQRGHDLAQEALRFAEGDFLFWVGQCQAILALSYQLQGDPRAAKELLERSKNFYKDKSTYYYLIYIPLAAREILWSAGEYQELLKEADEQLAFVTAQHEYTMAPDGLYSRGVALRGLGQLEQAREALHSAFEEAEHIGLVFRVWEIQATLGDLEEQMGNPGEAAHWRKRARGAVEKLIATIGDPELVASFSTLPRVTRLLKGD